MNELEKIKNYVIKLSKEVHLKKTEHFGIEDFHVSLSTDKSKGYDPVPYIDYDAKTKTIKGISPELIPKLVIFLSKTNNHHLINEMKKNLS